MCLKILANNEGKLLYLLEQDGRLYHCYMEEYAPYEIAKGKVDSEYALKEEMLEKREEVYGTKKG